MIEKRFFHSVNPSTSVKELVTAYLNKADSALYEMFKASTDAWLDKRESADKSSPREKAVLLLKP